MRSAVATTQTRVSFFEAVSSNWGSATTSSGISSFVKEDIRSFGPARRNVCNLLNNYKFEWFLGLLITTNFILIVLETEQGGVCHDRKREECIPEWLIWCNHLFLGIYTLEAALRIFAYRWAYFQDFWNLFDLCIVLSGYIDVIISLGTVDSESLAGMQMLRIFRIARLARAAKVVRSVPVLHTMLRGFYNAISTMIWGFILILLILLVWSVLAVEILGEASIELHKESPHCQDIFNSVFNCMLWFFQTLVAGDSWGECSKGLIEHSLSAAIIMAGSLITVQLGFTNLILAVIVERAGEAHEEDKQRQIMVRHKKRQDAETKLRQMCFSMDSDGNGTISNEELLRAYEVNQDLRDALHLLDIDQGDLQCLFQLMDADNSGDLTYDELISCIHKSDSNDLKRQMMMVKLQVEDIWMRVRDHVESSVDRILQVLNLDSVAPAVSSRGATLRRTNSRTSPKAFPRSPKPPPLNDVSKGEMEPTLSNASTVPVVLKDLDEIFRSMETEIEALNIRCNGAARQVQPAELLEQPLAVPDEKNTASVIKDKLLKLHRWTDEKLAVVLESIDERNRGLPDVRCYEPPETSLGTPGACFSRV